LQSTWLVCNGHAAQQLLLMLLLTINQYLMSAAAALHTSQVDCNV